MSRFCWWLVDIASRALDRGERDAVRGDLAEAGETGSQALFDVLGLVIRRQAALWKNPLAWLVLLALVLPLGVWFCLLARRLAYSSATYLWLYANNWDWTFVNNPVYRHDFAYYMGALLLQYLTLFCGAWVGGFILASASRRSLPFHAVLFVLLVLFGAALGPPPRHFGYALFYRARDFTNNSHAVVFALPFYRIIYPLIVQLALVLVPSLWGMSRAAARQKGA